MFEKGFKITVMASVLGPTERHFLDRLFSLMQKGKETYLHEAVGVEQESKGTVSPTTQRGLSSFGPLQSYQGPNVWIKAYSNS